MSRHRKPPLIVIAGPTAAGKSELAVRLAKKFNGEIISADSRQVYRGLNIGTGKVPGRFRAGAFWYRGIRHHLIDVASPRRRFSVAEFKAKAEAAIHDIQKRGTLPFLVGGTGFYLDAVIRGLALPVVAPNPALRKRLERKTAPELLVMLRRADPRRARQLDPQNKRRIIRAIEIVSATKRPVPPLRRRSPYRTLVLVLDPPAAELYRRVVRRQRRMFRRGLLEEVKQLRASGVSWQRIAEFGLEYRLPALYLRGKLSRLEMEEHLKSTLRQLVRRQRQWFRRWEDARKVARPRQAERAVRDFIVLSPEYLAAGRRG